MSTVSLTDLMRELQAGEEARAKVPALTKRIEDLVAINDKANDHVVGLETNIIDYVRQIDGLASKVRSLEVERDDAGFRELEAQDKLNRVLATMRSASAALVYDADHVDPPAPKPIAPEALQSTPVPLTEEPGVSQSAVGQSDVNPTAPPTVSQSGDAYFEAAASSVSVSSSAGQSEPNPIPAADATPSVMDTATHTTVLPPSAVAPENAASPDPQAYRPFGGDVAGADPKPNEGKPYHLKPDTMTWGEWGASGGEQAPWL